VKNIYLINAHQPYSFSEGSLNNAITQRVAAWFTDHGYATRTTITAQGFDVESELKQHLWADVIFLQSPVNWMGVPWSFKKYMDEVYSAGMAGALCDGDGRSRTDPSLHYGSGGTLAGKKYMLSLTFNAPREAFDDPDQYLFGGKGVDDLLFPMHMNFRFFGMESLPTFACYDVLKNPDIENDFQRLAAHLVQQF